MAAKDHVPVTIVESDTGGRRAWRSAVRRLRAWWRSLDGRPWPERLFMKAGVVGWTGVAVGAVLALAGAEALMTVVVLPSFLIAVVGWVVAGLALILLPAQRVGRNCTEGDVTRCDDRPAPKVDSPAGPSVEGLGQPGAKPNAGTALPQAGGRAANAGDGLKRQRNAAGVLLSGFLVLGVAVWAIAERESIAVVVWAFCGAAFLWSVALWSWRASHHGR